MNLKSIIFLIDELREKEKAYEQQNRHEQAREMQEQIRELKDSLFVILRNPAYEVEMEEDYRICFTHSQQAKSNAGYS